MANCSFFPCVEARSSLLFLETSFRLQIRGTSGADKESGLMAALTKTGSSGNEAVRNTFGDVMQANPPHPAGGSSRAAVQWHPDSTGPSGAAPHTGAQASSVPADFQAAGYFGPDMQFY
jgi:hypothetical protein